MKLHQLLFLGLAPIAIGSVSLASQVPSPELLSNPIASGKSTQVIQVANQAKAALKSGNFVAAEKPTTGIARIVSENGHRYLELTGTFSTSDQGPDLHVLLDTSNRPPQSYQNLNSFINLGKLRNYSGAQRYPIPDAINVGNVKSVVIWCRMANATFGYAALK